MFWFEFSTRRTQAKSESPSMACTASMFHVLLSSYVAHSHSQIIWKAPGTVREPESQVESLLLNTVQQRFFFW